MSSEVISTGTIAPAVMFSAEAAIGLALGPLWLAWQGGKLAVEAGAALLDDIKHNLNEKQKRLNEIAVYRKKSVLETHKKLENMCIQILNQLNDLTQNSEIEQLRSELNSIIHETIPEDIKEIQEITSSGFAKLKK